MVFLSGILLGDKIYFIDSRFNNDNGEDFTMKKSISWVLSLALVCSLGMFAFAAGSKTVAIELSSVTVDAEAIVTADGEAVVLEEGQSLVVEVLAKVASAEETLTEAHVGGLAELVLAVDVASLGLDADADEETVAAAVSQAIDTKIREIFAESTAVAEVAEDETVVLLDVLDISIDFSVQDDASGSTTVYNTDENGVLYATVTIEISNYSTASGNLFAYHESDTGESELIPCTVASVDEDGNAVISFDVSSGSPFTFIQIIPTEVAASTGAVTSTVTDATSSSVYLVIAIVALVALVVLVVVVRARKKDTDKA